MEKNLKNYWTLFFSTLYISALTFGGGYVIISLMKNKFVTDLGWIDEEEMLNFTAIAQSAPGPVAVNAAIVVGWRVAGLSGAAVAMFATILPPLVFVSIVSRFYVAFKDNVVFACVLRGMMPGVAAVIFDVVISMGGKILGDRQIFPICIMVGAFVAGYIFNVNVVYIILFCGFLGALTSARKQKTREETSA